MKVSRSFFFLYLVLGLLSDLGLVRPNAAEYAQMAQDAFATALEVSNKFKINEDDIQKLNENIAKLQNDTVYNYLSSEQRQSLQEALAMLKYGGALEDSLINLGQSWDEENEYLQLLNSTIALDEEVVEFEDSFLGNKQRLLDSLNKYQYLDVEKLKIFINENKIIQVFEILGQYSDKEFELGLIDSLVDERLDDSFLEIKFNEDGHFDAKRSWSADDDISLRSILRKIRVVLANDKLQPLISQVDNFENFSLALNQKIDDLFSRLSQEVTPQEQIQSIVRVVNRGYIDGLANELKNRCKKLIETIDSSVSLADKKLVYNAIENFAINNNYSLSDFVFLLNAFSRSTMPSEIFQDQEVFALQVNINEDSKYLNISEQGVFRAEPGALASLGSHLEAVIVQDKIAILSRTEGTKRVLSGLSGEFEVISDDDFENLKQGALPDKDKYLFFVEGSRDKLSLQSASSLDIGGGVLTVSVSSVAKTVNDLTSKPILNLDAKNNIIQNDWNSFKVLPISSAIIQLSKLVKEIKQDAEGIVRLIDVLSLFLAVSSEEKIVLVEQIINVIEDLSKEKSGFDSLREYSQDLEQVIIACNDLLLPGESQELIDLVEKLNSIWDYFINTDFIAQADSLAPQNGDVIAFLDRNSNKYLKVVEEKQLDGSVRYYLSANADSPIISSTHLEVVAFKSLLGFKSELTDGLIRVQDGDAARLEFGDLQNGLFQHLDNSNFHFDYKVENNNEIYLKVKAEDGVYLSIDSNGFLVADSTKRSKVDAATFSLVYVNDFYRQLAKLSDEKNVSKQIEGFASLADFIETEKEAFAFIGLVTEVFQNLKLDKKAWIDFVNNADSLKLVEKIFVSLESLEISLPSIASSLSDLINLYQEAYRLDLQEFLEKRIFISWRGAKGDVFFLNSDAEFASREKIDSKIVLSLEINQDDSISFKDSRGFYLGQNAQSGFKFIEDKETASDLGWQIKFRYIGDANDLSLLPIDDTGSLEIGNLENFVSVKTDRSLAISPGIGAGRYVTDQDGVETELFDPLIYQQVFSLGILSELEEKLISAKSWLDIEDIGNSESILSQVVGAYDSILKEMINRRKDYSNVDFELFINQLSWFVNTITTKADGVFYVTMLQNQYLNDLFEISILANLDKLQLSKEMGKMVFEIKVAWQEGYVGGAGLEDNDLIAIKVLRDGQFYYLQAKENKYQGQSYLQLQAEADSLLLEPAQFRVKTYKDKFGIVPLVAQDKMLLAFDENKQDSSARILQRLNFVNFDKDVRFGIEGTEQFQLEMSQDKDTGSFKIKNLFDELIGIDGLDENYLKISSQEAVFYIEKIEPIHEKLTSIYSSTDSLLVLSTILELLDERYINSENKDLFLDLLTKFFVDLKSDSVRWKQFSSLDDNLEIVEAIFALLQEQAEIVGDDNIVKLQEAYSGNVSVSLADFSNKQLLLAWKYKDGEVFYLNLSSDSPIEFVSRDKFDIANQFNLVINEKGEVKIKNSSDKDSYLTIDSLEEATISTGGSGREVFKTIGSVNSLSLESAYDSNTFLTVDPISRQITLSPGVEDVSGTVRPLPNTQTFELVVLSNLEIALAKNRLESNLTRKLDTYFLLIEDLIKNDGVREGFVVLFEQIKQFLLDYTSEFEKYQIISANEDLDFRLTALLARLEEVADKDKILLDQVLAMVNLWDEGFIGQPLDGSPIANDVLFIQDQKTKKILQVVETVYQGKTYYNLQFSSDDKLDKNTHFKVSNYKDKFGFESIVKPGMFIYSPLINNTNNIIEPLSKLVLRKMEDENEKKMELGSVGSQGFQFIIKAGVGDGFVLQDVSNDGFLFNNDKDLNFGKINLDKDLAAQVGFQKLTSLNNKLIASRDALSDLDKINLYKEAISDRFILSDEDARLFISELERFVESKVQTLDIWQEFSLDSDLVLAMKELLELIEKSDLLRDISDNLRERYSLGFVEKIASAESVQIYWTGPDGIKKIFTVDFIDDKSAQIVVKQGTRFDPNSLFKIEYNDNGYALIRFLSPSGKSFVLSCQDMVGKLRKTQFETFDNQDLNAERYLFESMGSLGKFSLKSLRDNCGFLSVGKLDSILSSLSEPDLKPAGIEVNEELIPSSYEQFQVQVVRKTLEELILLATSSNITDSILGYLEYPSYYQSQNNLILSMEEQDRSLFLDSIEHFVDSVTTNKFKADVVSSQDRLLFDQLMQLLANMDFNLTQKERIEVMLQNWQRGYLGEVHPLAPKDKSKFIIYQGSPVIGLEDSNLSKKDNLDDSGWNVESKEEQDNKQKEKASDSTYGIRNLQILLNDKLGDDVYCLALANDTYKDILDEEARFENFLIENDPFKNESVFTAIVSGDTFGMKSLSENLKGKVLAIKDLGTQLYSEQYWNQICAKFEDDKFFEDFENNNQHFEIIDGVDFGFGKIIHKVTGLALTSNSKDRFLRTYTLGQDGEVVAVDKDFESKEVTQFAILEFNGLLEDLYGIRQEKDNKKIAQIYSQAVGKVKTEVDLQLLLDDIFRLIVLKKTSKQVWDEFVSLTSYMESLEDTLNLIKGSFGEDNPTLKLNQKTVDRINRYINYISGVTYPDFSDEIKVESSILDFRSEYNVLKNKFSSLSSNTTNEFFIRLQNLVLKRVELDSNNVGLVEEVANWLEYQVSQDQDIVNAKLTSSIEEVAAKLRLPLGYQDMVDYLNFVLENIKGFSIERSLLFVHVFSKMMLEENMALARDEKIGLDDIKQVLKKAMANQLGRFLSISLSSEAVIKAQKSRNNLPLNIVWADGVTDDIKGASLQDILLYWIENMRYPIMKNQEYLNFVLAKIDEFRDSKSDLEKQKISVEVVDNLQGWQDSLFADLDANERVDLGLEPDMVASWQQANLSSLIRYITNFIGLNSQLQPNNNDQLNVILNQMKKESGASIGISSIGSSNQLASIDIPQAQAPVVSSGSGLGLAGVSRIKTNTSSNRTDGVFAQSE